MQNSIAAGRRLAIRVVLAQIGATALAATVFLLHGPGFGLAVLSGGAVVAAGTAVLALRLFGTAPAPAGTVLAHLVVGSLLKWGIITLGLYAALVRLGLPALPVLVGVAAALLPQLLGLHEPRARRR